MKFLGMSFGLVLFSVTFLDVSGKSNYTFGLIRYLKEKSKLHQVIFIIDDQFLANAESNANAQLVGDVAKHFPSLSISSRDANDGLEKYFSLHLQIPRRTTLFTFILERFGNNTNPYLYAMFEKLYILSYENSFPKCLIYFSNEIKARSYEELLTSLWHIDMLDISVLETLVQNQTWQTRDVATIHRINLFAKKYTKLTVKPRTKWFPNKLLDLHRQRIKLMLIINGTYISAASIIEVVKFIYCIVQSLHCGIDFLPFGETVKSSYLQKVKAELVVSSVTLKEINNNIVNSVPMRILLYSTAKAVILNAKSKTQSVEVSEELIYMIVATTVTIAALRIAALLLRFDRSTWNTFSISQIIMGMSVIKEPRKLAERIVFGVFMLSCMVYSGYVFSVILDINFQEVPQISTLEELANSSLTPMISPFINATMANSPLVHVRKLAFKSVIMPGNGLAYDCLEYLHKNRNVTCILLDAEAAVKIRSSKTQEFRFEVIQESIVYFPTTWSTRTISPLKDRFNEIILKAFDHGLLQKLLIPGYNLQKKVVPATLEIIEKEKLLLVLFYVLIIGYTLAIIVLIAEILINFIIKKAQFFFMFSN